MELPMEGTWIFLAVLFLFTMIATLAFVWNSKRKTERRMEDDNAPKSTLAKDGPGPNPATAPRDNYAPPRDADDPVRADRPEDRQRA